MADDLFAYAAETEALWKRQGTSSLAALRASRSAIRNVIWALAYLDDNGPSTPDEVASGLGKNILSIRPRFTQAEDAGWVRLTSQKRQTSLGSLANVYAITDAGRSQLERVRSAS